MKKYYVLIILFCFFIKTKTIQAQEKTTIFWDASYAMKNRNLKKELQFLEHYFKQHPTNNITLNVFSTHINLHKKYLIKNANWQALKQELTNVVYDGVALLDALQTKTQTGSVLIFTDGISVLDTLIVPKNTLTTLISNNKNIQEYVKGSYRYINLQTNSQQKITTS